MVTRCKVRCVELTKRETWNRTPGAVPFLFWAKFQFVSDGSPENKAFFEATPSGTLQVDTVKADHFEVGKDYYIDFTLAANPSLSA